MLREWLKHIHKFQWSTSENSLLSCISTVQPVLVRVWNVITWNLCRMFAHISVPASVFHTWRLMLACKGNVYFKYTYKHISAWGPTGAPVCTVLCHQGLSFPPALSNRLCTVHPHAQHQGEEPLAVAHTSDNMGIWVWHQLCRNGGNLYAEPDISSRSFSSALPAALGHACVRDTSAYT